MLSREEQFKEWDRVVAMCKGTKFEGREYLCVKYGDDKTWIPYAGQSGLLLSEITRSRIFAIAIVDNTPIWLEEHFTLYAKDKNDLVYIYDKERCGLVGVTSYPREVPIILNFIRAFIPIRVVIWKNFTLTQPSIHVESTPVSLGHPEVYLQGDIADTPAKLDTTWVNTKQVGGTHYKDKAIQPWAYMEANFTKEEFVGFLRGNAHKYLDRYKDKNGIEDLKKAIHYIEKLIQVEGK